MQRSRGGVFCSGDSTSHERRQLRLKDLSVVHSWPAIGSSAAPAAHILHDPTISHDSEPCGLCLRPAPLCQFTLTKGKGRNSKPKIQMSGKNTSQCRNLLSFQYSAAAEMTDASPRTNVPIRCPRCSVDDPAVWRYNMEIHFRKQHPDANTCYMLLSNTTVRNTLAAMYIDMYKLVMSELAASSSLYIWIGI